MRVLVIDDDTLNRRLLRSMLETGGLSVVEASSGPEALDVISRIAVDIVLMDLRMPFMDGLEATRIIRDRKGADLPLAIITADTAPNLEEACTAAGADILIRKPFNMGELHDAIGRLWARSAREGALLV